MFTKAGNLLHSTPSYQIAEPAGNLTVTYRDLTSRPQFAQILYNTAIRKCRHITIEGNSVWGNWVHCFWRQSEIKG